MERPLSASQFDSASVISVLRNLKIDCASNTQVIVRSGTSVGSDDGKKVMTLTGDKTLDITTSGVNGLDTGAEAGNTWYYIYLIWNPTTALVNGLLSASATAPTLPSGYTKKRLIGAVRNNASSNFLPFRQAGRDVYTIGNAVLEGGVSGSMTAVDVTSYIPIAVAAQGMFSYRAGGSGYVMLSWDGPLIGWWAMASDSGNNVHNATMIHKEGNVWYQSNSAMYLFVNGFILDL
jgi:hypothetical protein